MPVKDDDRLVECLAALSRQDYPAGLVEVIVVDNGSTCSPPPVVERFPIARLLHEPRAGSYAARNTGVAAATGELLAFTDADCIPSPTWLTAAAAALQEGADIVAGHVEVFARHPRGPARSRRTRSCTASRSRSTCVGGACATANMVTTRACSTAWWPFLGGLLSGGDIEWTRRATSSGAVDSSTSPKRGSVIRPDVRR